VRAHGSVADVLAIFGPTASGKTDVAEAIARRIPAELVSADAMQVYRGLPILTNQSQSTARLVAIWPLDHEGSVGEYEQLAHAAIDAVLGYGRTPVVVGGTGLYLRAALAELAIPPEPTPGLRSRLESLYARLGPERTHALLAERDPAAAAGVHPNDRRRVVRALELAELGSSLRPHDHRLWGEQTRHPTAIFGLEVPKDVLDRRIEERARAMFEQGVEEEVRRAVAGPISRTAWNIHGLRPIAELPRDQALAELVRITRRYARYQHKWMRKIPGLVTVRADRAAGDVADEILEIVGRRSPGGIPLVQAPSSSTTSTE
jgi:tRNA dimethylallyltransferase